MQANELVVRTSEPPRLRVVERVGEIWSRREVLLNLVRKELKVKYVSSFLGAVWSLLNPIVFLAVFGFVALIAGLALPNFTIYLLSALLGWNFFTTSITNAARSVIDNGNLVKKVAFPREVLPLSSIGVAGFDYVLQTVVLFAFMAATRYGVSMTALLLFPLSVVTMLAFTSALSFLIAAVNVRYRDVQHLLNLALLVWFWMTPIVYPEGLVQAKLQTYHLAGVNAFRLYLLNPMVDITMGFHRALYGAGHSISGTHNAALVRYSTETIALLLCAVLLGSLILLRITWKVFFDLSGDFAEEL
ncbi:MAG: ABC transporter permease [Actinomycetota bacterium]